MLSLTLGGCPSFLIGAGLLISCGPMPLSFDQCDGAWVMNMIFGPPHVRPLPGSATPAQPRTGPTSENRAPPCE